MDYQHDIQFIQDKQLRKGKRSSSTQKSLGRPRGGVEV